MLVRDPGKTASSVDNDVHIQCCVKHPGLCATRHACFASFVLQVCKNLSIHFQNQGRQALIGRVCQFAFHTVHDGEVDVVHEYAVLAEIRYARPIMQVFVPCTVSDRQLLLQRRGADFIDMAIVCEYSYAMVLRWAKRQFPIAKLMLKQREANPVLPSWHT